jgi:hypothetical protein
MSDVAPPLGEGCANHPLEAAVTRCESCGRRLCARCWLRKVDGHPWCEACVADLELGARNPWPFGLTIGALSIAAAIGGWRAELRRGAEPSMAVWILVAIGGVVAGAIAATVRTRRAHGRAITLRTEDELPAIQPDARVGNPYRAGFRRLARRVAPPLSGGTTALILCGCFLVTGLAIPVALHLPKWLELELALGAWWAIWAGTLAWLLHRGFRLSDDLVYRAPRLPWGGDAEADAKAREAAARPGRAKKRSTSDACSGCGDFGVGETSGCGEAIVVVVVVAAVIAAAWVLVELVAPAVVFAAYTLVRGAVARVANDDHECEGDAPRALGWGAFWATVYVAPLGALIWALHLWWGWLQR